MSQFELIDDYLTNRMDEAARVNFEQRMEADSQLKAEVSLQKGIIEGVKQARVAELKTMLNNVPVGGSSGALTGKIALATLSAGILGTVLYFAFQGEDKPQAITETEPIAVETPATQPEIIEEETTPATEQQEEVAKENQIVEKKNSAGVRKLEATKPASPKIEVMDLTTEMGQDNEETSAAPPVHTSKPVVSASSVEVETDNTNKTYPFHYQFKNDKLVLYGPFDSSLYEIIEINGGKHNLFLYYKDSFYHLDEKEHLIVPLIMIRDTELLSVLERYRNGKK
ncbi:MAG: hypothetical protein AB7O48_18325 [Cyclobacteriaceae bacterium]